MLTCLIMHNVHGTLVSVTDEFYMEFLSSMFLGKCV